MRKINPRDTPVFYSFIRLKRTDESHQKHIRFFEDFMSWKFALIIRGNQLQDYDYEIDL